MKFESFRSKSEEELKIQANKAEEVLGKNMYPPYTKLAKHSNMLILQHLFVFCRLSSA
jgi:hypothetical protein